MIATLVIVAVVLTGARRLSIIKARCTKNHLTVLISSVLLLAAAHSCAAGDTRRVSVSSAGTQGNSFSFSASLSADGRYVAFASEASNLVSGDTNGVPDIFVYDRINGITTRVSVNSEGEQATGDFFGSYNPTISAGGRYVAFASEASNLVLEDTNSQVDIFVHDRITGVTTRVSVDAAEGQGNSYSESSSISADGRYIAFNSNASNLVPEDTNGVSDIFVRDRKTGVTTRVNVGPARVEGNAPTYYHPAISADGRYVAFTSEASNLVPGDSNGVPDAFVHDRISGVTARVSIDSAGEQGQGITSYNLAISADGRYVVFYSEASNLVPGDTNEVRDAFVHDRISGFTTRVSVDSAGEQGNGDSFDVYDPSISADGRFVAFASDASNLVPEDTRGLTDIFVHDRKTGTTTRASVTSAGRQARYGDSGGDTSISADGRYVAFASWASNLVPGDTNGTGDVFVRDILLNRHKNADLQLAVTSRPASVQAGQTASYTYTVTNIGPDNIEASVNLTDVIANGNIVRLIPSQGFCRKAAVSVCRFGELATSASLTLTAVVKAGSGPNPLTQQLSVNARPVDNVQDNNSVTVSTPMTP